MRDPVDWQALAEELGTFRQLPGSDACGEAVSGKDACRALEIIVGADVLRDAVDYYVSLRPGAELARLVLIQLSPESTAAMQRCREIIESDACAADRRTATELLRSVSDDRVLPWIPSLLEDDDSGVRLWGLDIVLQLLWSGRIEPEDAEDLLRVAEQHSDSSVRAHAARIRHYHYGGPEPADE